MIRKAMAVGIVSLLAQQGSATLASESSCPRQNPLDVSILIEDSNLELKN